MGFNSGFKGLIEVLLLTSIVLQLYNDYVNMFIMYKFDLTFMQVWTTPGRQHGTSYLFKS